VTDLAQIPAPVYQAREPFQAWESFQARLMAAALTVNLERIPQVLLSAPGGA
jgi:hypothetical protein